MKTLTFEDSSKLYFTSDLHLGHENILQFCNRPFKDVDEMDKVIIDNWIATIHDDDIVFVLGDFCWKLGSSSIRYYTNKLPGHKILILGNHDHSEKPLTQVFNKVYDGFVNINIRDDEATKSGGYQRITLCHYPMLSWYQSHRGAWQLFGHWHNAKIEKPTESGENIQEANKEVAEYVVEEHFYMRYTRSTQYDIGVDGNDFIPISYYKIKEIIQKNLELSK